MALLTRFHTRFVRHTRLTAVLLLIAASLASPIVQQRAALADGGAGSPSAFTPLEACRAFDSRSTGARIDGTVAVAIAGSCGVPADAAVVAATITVTQAAQPGYVTAFAGGSGRPPTSTVNIAVGQTRSSAALVALGGGAMQVFTSIAAHVLVDVSGYFTTATVATSGRFVAVVPTRLLDTRVGPRPDLGSSVTVTLPDSVPADAIGAAVTITTTASRGAGYFVGYAGPTVPGATALSTDGPNETRAAGVLVPVADRTFRVFTSTGDHVIVDMSGYFTGPSAPESSDGLFIPSAPVRVVDTRAAEGASGGPAVYAGGGREWATSALTGGPVAAVAGTLTVTQTAGSGWWVAYPAQAAKGSVSTVNADGPYQTVANFAVVPVSTAGIAVHGSQQTHVIVDVTGWFTGTPVEATMEPEVNTQPVPSTPVVHWPGTKQIALTFDDGPLGPTTAQVLDILNAENVHATFFVNCWRTVLRPDLVRRVVDAGDRVQNHTWSHPYLTRLDDADIVSQLASCSNNIAALTGVEPTAFRPPFGSTSARVQAIAGSLGLFQVMWNAGPSDILAGTGAILGETARQMRDADATGRGLVMLLHDGSGNRPGMLGALATIIERYRADGWQFVLIG